MIYKSHERASRVVNFIAKESMVGLGMTRQYVACTFDVLRAYINKSGVAWFNLPNTIVLRTFQGT